ncbi:hypothetical protein AB9P05_12010 [Roseivirga sp. BDSF3-8]
MKNNKIKLRELKVKSFIADPEKLRAGINDVWGVTPDSPYCVQTWDNC